LIGVTSPIGREEQVLIGVAPLADAGAEHVAYIQDARQEIDPASLRAGLVLAPTNLQLDHPAVVHPANVMDALVRLLHHFHPVAASNGIRHASAVIDATAELAPDVQVDAHAIIGARARIGAGTRIGSHVVIGEDVVIGENCRLHPRATVLDRCRIGNRVELHSGCVIGADGFRFEVIGRRLTKIPQVGIVVIEDDVEIGANTTIDRAGLSETRIGARTKIDNLVQVGHNCVIGSDCIIVSQVGIAGSCRIGRGVMIGGAASIKDHITIGDGAQIAGRSGVQHDLPAGSRVMGYPALPVKRYARFAWFYRNFDEQWERLKSALKERDSIP
jgi:UDP-3-O-[3-hydroxymyristoyl] glucosamine N-acyltransferase